MSLLRNPNEIEVPQEVLAAAVRGHLTFFIGNGVSRLYGTPSWDELANGMLACLVKHQKMNHSEYEILCRLPIKTKISIADYYFKLNAEAENISTISYREILMNGVTEEKIRSNVTYSLLAKCRVKFLTTNYDSLLADILNGQSITEVLKPQNVSNSGKIDVSERDQFFQEYDVFTKLEDFKKSDILRTNFLIHLHGSISDDKTLIVSTKDYLDFYGDSNRQELLSLIFENQTILFIGYGLEDLEILDIIVKAGRSRSEDVGKHPRFFLLLSLLSHEAGIIPYLKIYYEELNVTLVTYCRDKEGHFALNGIIDRWSRELAGICNEPTRSDSVKVLDSLMSELERISR